MNSKIRTDLASEAHELWARSAEKTSELPGVRAQEEDRAGFRVSTVEILDERGERSLGKPRGRYVTVWLGALIRREEDAFETACGVLSDCLRELLPGGKGGVLVAGLGNRGITPDAVGPESVRSVMVTRHLREQLPEYFGSFREVSAVCSGVLGTTGIESGDIVAAVVQKVRPAAVIAVDALAAAEPDKLCCTVQLTDAGIVPGSGVGNARRELSPRTLGVPVIAVGVPTVVDSAALAVYLAGKCGVELTDARGCAGMIVTPRDIDKSVADISKLVGYSVNLALHEGLSLGDIDMFLS